MSEMSTVAPPTFRLPGWDDENSMPEPEPTTATGDGETFDQIVAGPETVAPATSALLAVGRKQTRKKQRGSRAKRVIGGTLVSAIALGGVAAITLGVRQASQLDTAPIPDDTVYAEATDEVRGPLDDVDTNAGQMTVEKMAPLSYFIPSLGVYSQIVPTGDFNNTRYDAFQGLVVPDDPTKSAWYSAGGALAGNEPGTQGTTLLAAHVIFNGKRGVLHELGTLEGGEIVYVKDSDGTLSAWKVVELRTLMHTEFPQEYWAADGERRLVVTTCVGYDPETKHYMKNIFAVAVPVDPETGQPFPEPVETPTPDQSDDGEQQTAA